MPSQLDVGIFDLKLSSSGTAKLDAKKIIEQCLDIKKSVFLQLTVSTTLQDVSPANQGGTFVYNEADKTKHIFKPGKLFGDAVKLYYFDKSLRGIIFSAIQFVEIALRTSIIQNFSMKHGPFWFMDASLFKNTQIYNECVNSIQAELSRTKEDFIQEHFAKYDSPNMPPAWKTLEVVSFGTLGKLFSNFKDNTVKKTVARGFNVPQHVYLESWIASLAALRNCCAHHARVWNRVYPIKPQLPKSKMMRSSWIDISNIFPNRLYAILCCLLYWTNNISSDNSFKTDIVGLLRKNPIVDVAAMGFPHGWDEEPLWCSSATPNPLPNCRQCFGLIRIPAFFCIFAATFFIKCRKEKR